MSYVILDLEWNGSYCKKLHRFVNEIIEFGAVKLDGDMNMTDTFSMLVKPQIGKKISSHIESLTHISNDELIVSDNTFLKTINRFIDFAGDSVILTWGKSDILALMENYDYYTGNDRLPFLKYYCDLQYYCEKKLNIYNPAAQLGLQSCADMLGIKSSEETLHRAYADAELSYYCFKELFSPSDINNYISAADEDFYRKITFKNRRLTDIDNPMIDKSKMFFNCDECGIIAEQITRFRVKNKSFVAGFRCPKCRRQFKGRVTANLRFDGVTLNKKIIMPAKVELPDD